ncbi:MAG TPA: hypothetical protein VLA95_10830 [Gemmatimonadales bacterium]|nr:hypothetical protein [Gemmatimonadales bacterium]
MTATGRWAVLGAMALVGGGCGGDDGGTEPPPPPGGTTTLVYVTGRGQTGLVSEPLDGPFVVEARLDGEPREGAEVAWEIIDGSGTLSATTLTTDVDGRASVTLQFGPDYGLRQVQARLVPDGTPILFDARAYHPLPLAGGGDNVPDRFTSDLWLHGDYAYTGTWGAITRNGNFGDVLKVWQLGAEGAPALVREVPIPDISTVSDVEVSADGALLLATTEGQSADGLYLFSLADPSDPTPVDFEPVASGLHTGTFAEIGGARYVFAARNPGSPALMVWRIDPAAPDPITPVGSVAIPADYGIHDTFVRDGLAFVSAWNTGLIIYDVGDGRAGGSPASPREVSRIVTSANGVPGGPAVHNAWWFHNPVTSEKRYVFVGQEGPGAIGSSSSGDLHVVDVSNLANPVEVASLRIPGAGVHNFWMDEPREILYAAFYNGGVVALDVSGTLSGNLTGRIMGQARPGGSSTYVWGVMAHRGSLYLSDMVTGLWQLTPP